MVKKKAKKHERNSNVLQKYNLNELFYFLYLNIASTVICICHIKCLKFIASITYSASIIFYISYFSIHVSTNIEMVNGS